MVNSQKGISTIVVVIIIALAAAAGITGYMLLSGSMQTPNPAQNGSTIPTTQQQMNPTETEAKVIEVTGENFSFSPPNIIVKNGETVKIVLSAVDMPHDFVIDELNVNSGIANPGEMVEVEFAPTEAGEYEYYCSVGNHREMGMVGTLTVTE